MGCGVVWWGNTGTRCHLLVKQANWRCYVKTHSYHRPAGHYSARLEYVIIAGMKCECHLFGFKKKECYGTWEAAVTQRKHEEIKLWKGLNSSLKIEGLSHTHFTHLLSPAGRLGLLLSAVGSCCFFSGVEVLADIWGSFWPFCRLWLSVSAWLLLWLAKLRVRNTAEVNSVSLDWSHWDLQCFFLDGTADEKTTLR